MCERTRLPLEPPPSALQHRRRNARERRSIGVTQRRPLERHLRCHQPARLGRKKPKQQMADGEVSLRIRASPPLARWNPPCCLHGCRTPGETGGPQTVTEEQYYPLPRHPGPRREVARHRGSRPPESREQVPDGTPPPLGKANGAHCSQQATVPIFEVAPGDPPSLRERRLSWSELMMRVFREDVLRCKKCGGRAAVISAIAQPKGAEATLVCLGLAVRAPPPHPRAADPVRPSKGLPFDSFRHSCAHRPLAGSGRGQPGNDSAISAAATGPAPTRHLD